MRKRGVWNYAEVLSPAPGDEQAWEESAPIWSAIRGHLRKDYLAADGLTIHDLITASGKVGASTDIRVVRKAASQLQAGFRFLTEEDYNPASTTALLIRAMKLQGITSYKQLLTLRNGKRASGKPTRRRITAGGQNDGPEKSGPAQPAETSTEKLKEELDQARAALREEQEAHMKLSEALQEAVRAKGAIADEDSAQLKEANARISAYCRELQQRQVALETQLDSAKETVRERDREIAAQRLTNQTLAARISHLEQETGRLRTIAEHAQSSKCPVEWDEGVYRSLPGFPEYTTAGGSFMKLLYEVALAAVLQEHGERGAGAARRMMHICAAHGPAEGSLRPLRMLREGIPFAYVIRQDGYAFRLEQAILATAFSHESGREKLWGKGLNLWRD